MNILHISTDYPDAFNPAKTAAIQRLVESAADGFEHHVYSLNRIDVSPLALGQRAIAEHDRKDGLSCWTYQAPSKGLFLKQIMQTIGDRIAQDAIKEGLKPDLVIGHKLSMEGIAAHCVAERLGIPFALSIQGNSDRTITNIRRDLSGLYRRIFHEAAIVFPFAPWAYQHMTARFGEREGPVTMLPCITGQDRIIAPQPAPNRIISAFHMQNWQLKNLPALVSAADHIAPQIDGFQMDIFGGGSEADMQQAAREVAKANSHTVALPGPVAPELIQAEMNNSAGFAMLSHKESFGMVFIEALLAGCPVVYPANAAIDGYFDACDFAIAAPAGDQDLINKAILELLQNQTSIKRSLARWQESGEAARFQKDAIVSGFTDGLRHACKVGGRGGDNA